MADTREADAVVCGDPDVQASVLPQATRCCYRRCLSSADLTGREFVADLTKVEAARGGHDCQAVFMNKNDPSPFTRGTNSWH